ncbi:MAG: uridine kinase [Bacteroidota bacterium]
MLVVGIAGGTGSGKTTVVKKLMKLLPKEKVCLLPQDSYYKDSGQLTLEERQKKNFDHPSSIEFSLLNKHIDMLAAGESIAQPIYSYITCSRSKETIPVAPKEVLIVEGILILTNPRLRERLKMKVFVDADSDERLIRVIKRDIEERGRSYLDVLERYEKTVKPMHFQFIEPSKRYADVIVPQGGNNHIAIDMLAHTILMYLKK